MTREDLHTFVAVLNAMVAAAMTGMQAGLIHASASVQDGVAFGLLILAAGLAVLLKTNNSATS